MPRDGWGTIGGRRIHYPEWGRNDARAIVMLHGLSGFAHDWDEFAPTLEDTFRFDLEAGVANYVETMKRLGLEPTYTP